MKRKALYSVICTVLILLLAAALLVACNDGVSETYILSFRDGTEVIARVELQSGESLQASDIPEAPFHADENFVGWFIGIKEITAGYTPERSGVVVAKYEKIIKYTATFDMGGAPGDAPADVTVVENNSIQLPSVSWVGHAFLGWKLGENADLYGVNADYVVTGDVAFVAQWQEIDYTVSFSLGGAPGEDPATQHGHYGDAIKLPDAPVWAEHTFLGWYDEAGEKKDAGDKITIQDNISFTAHWQSDHEASEFVGVWMSANNYGYVVVTAAGADAFDVKGYVVGAYEAFEAQDVAYDGALGQFVVTIYKAANQQQAENVAFSISGDKLRAAGSSISPVTFDHQTDDTLAGYYLYHDAEDEVLEVVAGGLVVTNTAKLFGATQPVFAYIAADGTDGYKLVYKQRTGREAAELSGSQFEVTADGNLHVHIADTCKLFVKGATAGESFDGPDGAKLYKYATVEGDVYAFRADATSDIVLATIEGTVAEGEEFTITYNGSSTKVCKLVDGDLIFKGEEEGEYDGALGTLVLDGFGGGTLNGKNITYSYTDDDDVIIIDGVTYTLDDWNETYTIDEGEVEYAEYHMVGNDSIMFTYNKGSVTLEGGSNPGLYIIDSESHYVNWVDVYTYFITVDNKKLEWHVVNNVLKLVCKSGESEYEGDYILDHTIEPDIYAAELCGFWASSDGSIMVKIDGKHVYIWGPDDDGWVEVMFDHEGGSYTDVYLSYKGAEVNIWITGALTMQGGPFKRTQLQSALINVELIGNFMTDDGIYVFVNAMGLDFKEVGSPKSKASAITKQDENDFTFTFNEQSYRIWKDGDQLKLSKADGSDEHILTVAVPDGTQALYKKGSRESVEFDGFGNFIYTFSSSMDPYIATYTVEDGNYIVSNYTGETYNGTWTVSYNGNVITSPDGKEQFEKDAVIDVTYGTYLLENSLILKITKWSVAISTPAHNEFEETFDITVNADGTYTFTLLGNEYTLSDDYDDLYLDSSELEHFTSVFDTTDGYYAYHNIVTIESSNIKEQSVRYEGSEFIYTVTLQDGTTYEIKKDGGSYTVYYEGTDQWYDLTTTAEPRRDYPHGVWQLEDGGTKITISGLIGNNVEYDFAVEGGSRATTNSTWTSSNKQFTVNINGIEYTVAGHGQILLITGDGGLAGIYNRVGDAQIDFFTEEWFGQWTTIDYKHTIKIVDSHTVQYKGKDDAKFYETEVVQYSATNFELFNITIKGGVNADNKWVIEYTASAGMKFGENASSADIQMYKDIFPHDWVGPWQSDDGQYVNIYVDHVDYAASANSAWVAMASYQNTGDKDFNLTFGDSVYRLYEDGGAFKLSKDGSEHTLSKRAADILQGKKYIDDDEYSSAYLFFDGFGSVLVSNYDDEYNGSYYIDGDTVYVTCENLGGEYKLSEHNHVIIRNVDGTNYSYSETPIFEGIEGIYIGKGVIVVISRYSIIIATNEHTTSEEAFEIVNQNGEGKEYHFNAFDTSYVLTNASGSLTLNSTELTKIPSSLYANDNAYAVGFNGTAITFNKEAVEEYTVSFVDGKPTISFNVSDVAYTITKDTGVYKISANGASYDMSTTPATPATLFGTWTKDDITLTIDYNTDDYVFITIDGGTNGGEKHYQVKHSPDNEGKNLTRSVEIGDVTYAIAIMGKTLKVTGEGEYAGTYSKTATTEPEIVHSNLLGVFSFTYNPVKGVTFILIVTTQHMWLRDLNDKGGTFEDMYDIVPYSSSTQEYKDVYVYWTSIEDPVEIYSYYSGGMSMLGGSIKEYTACGDVTSPEQFIAWELAN